MSTDLYFSKLEQKFKKVIEHLKEEFSRLQIGRASAGLVEHVEVEAYGSKQILKSLANISVPDARTISIQPWDKSLLTAIEKGIQLADLGLNPSNDGNLIRINIPPLTEERRKDLAKLVHKIAEESRIAVRNARHEILEEMRKAEKDKLITETELVSAEKKLQEKIDGVNKQIENLAKDKEKDIMTI